MAPSSLHPEAVRVIPWEGQEEAPHPGGGGGVTPANQNFQRDEVPQSHPLGFEEEGDCHPHPYTDTGAAHCVSLCTERLYTLLSCYSYMYL